MNLAESKTLVNLMRAFAGECQARTRYYFAAGNARDAKLPVIARVFEYTADQEYEHAGIFYKHMRSAGVRNVDICAGYPVDLQTDCLSLLRDAQHNESEERHIVYPDFARTAEAEGFTEIAYSFNEIARIEQSHCERFALLADWMEAGKLFATDGEKTHWLCLNCGNIIEAVQPPQMCPVCQHEQGYYVRLEYAPFAAN